MNTMLINGYAVRPTTRGSGKGAKCCARSATEHLGIASPPRLGIPPRAFYPLRPRWAAPEDHLKRWPWDGRHLRVMKLHGSVRAEDFL